MYSPTQNFGVDESPVYRVWLSPIIAIGFGYLVLRFIYDVFFHPLADCPGPFFAKFSKLPNFYHAIKGDRHIWIWQNHQIYGDKVRIHPNEVLFLAPQAHKDIYGAKANVRRATSYKAWQTSVEPNTALTIDPQVHARKRKILNQAFTEKSVKHAASFVVEHTERWIDLLSGTKDAPRNDGWTASRNMSDWNDWLVFDILGDLCFGRSFDVKEPAPNPIRKIPHLIIQHVQLFYPILQSPFLNFFVWAKPRGLDYLLNFITPEEVKSYYKFINDSVTKRIQMEQDSKNGETARMDMFHFLCAATDPVTGEHYSEDALQGEAAMLIVAASDSTSTILAALWFYLSRNESVYKRLVLEIRDKFINSDDIVTGPKLASCTYLYACIDEALRIAPAGASEFAREVLPGGTTINGEYFPAGVVVGCAHWAMGHNEYVFGDPNRFRPERYIPSDATGVTVEEVNHIKSYYQPFLIGPTNCVGKTIAITEMALVVARTLFRMDLRAVPGENLGAGHPSLGWGRRDEKQYHISDAYITVHEGPILQFRKRIS
ncbi:benzoate 4-monooxygenase cytochrome P450 [Karstenula rhodostoma CBS 690.94]|uniref:Benzoate 4-monooxygenase cytochrome P450 n=1 Tax=Karstenula rhodostoma CBS 690.94 TaxID=1392251 RepID=A0A9P4PPV6_9PLEO|nr:benzoate 4-monooxygenase cytochrome P450 [Karstenula rhodostoma CBS 690.94]